MRRTLESDERERYWNSDLAIYNQIPHLFDRVGINVHYFQVKSTCLRLKGKQAPLFEGGKNEAQEKSASVELIIKCSDVNSKQFFPYIQQDAYFFKENFKTR